MEQSGLAQWEGTVTFREENGQLLCSARRSDDRRGLYKAYLTTAGGQVTLGALLPEEGALALRRTLSVAQLRGRGLWPVTGGCICLSFPAGRAPLPEGWTQQGISPALFPGDRVLAEGVAQLDGALLRRESWGFRLAVPYRERAPFGLTALFCFAEIRRLGREPYAIFSFSKNGRPFWPYKEAEKGNTKDAKQSKGGHNRGKSHQ